VGGLQGFVFRYLRVFDEKRERGGASPFRRGAGDAKLKPPAVEWGNHCCTAKQAGVVRRVFKPFVEDDDSFVFHAVLA
jgi:hypothetical protein